MSKARVFVPFVFALPLAAQGLLLTPDPQQPQPPEVFQPGIPSIREAQVAVVRTTVRAEIVDGVASTTVEQTFRNAGGRDAEGTWFLPVPAGAVADGFTMTVGGKETAGEVLDQNQARQVYEQIVRQRRDPGLLEYAGEGLLRARIFPIPARGEVMVKVRLRQVLQPTGGLYEWAWPLRAAQLGDTGAGPLTLEVAIRSSTAIGSVIAPYTTAEIRREGQHAAKVTYESSRGQTDDLKVLYGLTEQDFGLHLLPWREAGNPGYFTMLVSPPRDLATEPIQHRCVQIVIDTSGSMAGAKIAQAKAAVRAFLANLRPEDVFQVVTFASGVQTFFETPQRATPEMVASATARVDRLEARGGTNISGALQTALEAPVPAPDDRGPYLSQVVFVTDGQPTIQLTQPKDILELTKLVDKQSMRVFALGVGDDIDVRLIDDLVLQHRGARDFVRNDENIEVKVSALCQKIAHPALTDVEVRCDGLDAFDVHPTRTRDLFCGELLQVSGRYRDAGQRTVRIRGQRNGQPKEYVFQVEFPALADRHPFVPTLWARQHVAALLDAIRRNGQQKELVDEVRQLATRHGIVTPYTSQLILEEGMRLAGGVLPPGTDRESAFDSNQWNSAVGLGGGAGGRAGGRRGAAAGPTTGGPAGPATPASAPAADTPQKPGEAAPGGSRDAGTARLPSGARTGAAAVEESKATEPGAFFSDDFYLGGAADKKRATSRQEGMLRRAAGRVFVVIGDDLVEQGLPDDWAKQAEVVESFSTAYFELLKAQPKLRDVLALGERVVFRDGKRLVHVRPAPKVPAPAKPPEAPVVK